MLVRPMIGTWEVPRVEGISTHEARRRNIQRMADAILGASRASSGLRSAVNHVLGFWTWHSLAVDEGCSPDEAANLAVGFVLSARRGQVS